MNHKEQVLLEILHIGKERLEHHILWNSFNKLKDLNSFIYSTSVDIPHEDEDVDIQIESIADLTNNLHEQIRNIVNRINELEYHCECETCLIKSEVKLADNATEVKPYEVDESTIDRTIDPIEYMCMCGKCTEFISMNPCIIEERIRREQERVARFAQEDAEDKKANNANNDNGENAKRD